MPWKVRPSDKLNRRAWVINTADLFGKTVKYIFEKQVSVEMSDVDGNELEIDGIPVGKSLHKRKISVEEWVEGNGFIIVRTMLRGSPRNCFFCGSSKLFYKDYCEMCYNDFVKKPEDGLI
jgi:hypothetical protein